MDKPLKRGTLNMLCHKCQYNGKGLEVCLSCNMDKTLQLEDRKLKYRPQPSDFIHNSLQSKPTINETDTFDAEMERFKHALIDIFQLSNLELLLLKSILTGKTLSEFGNEIESFSDKHKTCSRHHAFQTRKSILKKLPNLMPALITQGQRKPLKP